MITAGEHMKEIKDLVDGLALGDGPEVITNPFSGRSVKLDPVGVALYDLVKGCELIGDYKTMGLALEAFSVRYPEEYYILLD